MESLTFIDYNEYSYVYFVTEHSLNDGQEVVTLGVKGCQGIAHSILCTFLSDLSCVYSTLCYVSSHAKKHNVTPIMC